MNHASATPPGDQSGGTEARFHLLLRGLGFLMLLLMLASIIYSIWIALANWGAISV